MLLWRIYTKKLGSRNIRKKYFNSYSERIDDATNLKEWFQNFIVKVIMNKLPEFAESGSG